MFIFPPVHIYTLKPAVLPVSVVPPVLVSFRALLVLVVSTVLPVVLPVLPVVPGAVFVVGAPVLPAVRALLPARVLHVGPALTARGLFGLAVSFSSERIPEPTIDAVAVLISGGAAVINVALCRTGGVTQHINHHIILNTYNFITNF